jgi:hypothetical protein
MLRGVDACNRRFFLDEHTEEEPPIDFIVLQVYNK